MKHAIQPLADRSFYRSVFSIALPITVLNLFSFGVGCVDNVMLGQLGETAMAAASLGNQVFSIITSMAFGTTIAAVTLISQYWGKQDTASISKVIATCLRYTVAVCAVAAAVVFLFPQTIMGVFSGDAAVIAAGTTYLRIYALSFVLYAVSITLITSLRAIENVKFPMLINVLSYSVNICLNYCLIFGKLGFPQMGVTGAAAGTLLARVIELVVILLYFTFAERRITLRLHDLLHFDRRVELPYVKQMLPTTVTQVLYGVGCTMYPLVFGRLDTGAMAAYSVAFAANQLFTSAIFGLVNASCVLTGKAIGEGDRQAVMRKGRTFNWMCVAISLVSALALFLCKDLLLGLYAIGPDTLHITDQFLVLSAITMLPVGMEGMFAGGSLRGGGDATFNMISTNICLWLVGIPLVFVAGFWLHWPMWAVFLCTKLYFVIKAICCQLRFNSGKWIKDVTSAKKEQPISSRA